MTKANLRKKIGEVVDFSNLLDAFQKDKRVFLSDVITLRQKYSQVEDTEKSAVCLSLLAIGKYLNGSNYREVLSILNDAKLMAKKLNSDILYASYYFANACIAYFEKDLVQANLFENKLRNIDYDDSLIQKYITSLENLNLDVSLAHIGEHAPLLALLKIAREVSAETNIDSLLQIIAQETKLALNADRCTVFLYDKEKNELWSKVALGLGTTEIRFKADKGLAGHVATTGETINIKDAYEDNRFNKEIDLQTGYVTKTILCMPMYNINHDIVGVFQVLNKLDGNFNKNDEDLLLAIGSNAGISLENARLFNHQQKMYENQKYLFSSFIDTLAASIDARDKITSGHSSRVRMYAALISKQLNLTKEECEAIEQAAILHDIGKIGIKDSVLQKEGKLTEEEYRHIQQHVKITHDILSKIYSSEEFRNVVDFASSHHEKYDGSGYFRKLKGNEIPLGGRILAVSDVFDAITSKRHYRDKMPIKQALDIIKNGENAHFDKSIIEVFFKISLLDLVKVFVTEFDFNVNDDDELILSRHNVSDLYSMLSKNPEKLTEYEKCLISMFNHYYDNH